MSNFDSSYLIPAMGVAIDTVGFGRKDPRAQRDVPERIQAVAQKSLVDIGVQWDELSYHDTAGDGMHLFLPAGTDPTRALPGLLSATTTRLAEDNERYRDQIRVRMAIGFGLVGRGSRSLSGRLVIDLSRLVDSPPIRQAVADHPASDLVALVSHELHALVSPAGLSLTRVDVVMKEFVASAWLWVSPSRKPHALL
jgi:hypothetical protein